MWSKFKMTPANLEIFRFSAYISLPIFLMFYVGSNTHDKLNIPDFWPDPNRLNQIPKDRVELKQELDRMDAARRERKALKDAQATDSSAAVASE